MFEKNKSHTDFSFTLTMRQLSLSIAGLIALSFFVFLSGYFLGQKRAAQDFVYRADQDSLADQIYSSMCILYDPKDEEESENVDDSENAEPEVAIEVAEAADQKDETVSENTVAAESQQKKYKALLCGFPATHLTDAKQFIARLQARGYPAELVENTSSNKQGKTKTWYQVVVKHDSKEYLENAKAQFAKIGYIKEQSIKIELCA